jgi:hypothetical protein
MMKEERAMKTDDAANKRAWIERHISARQRHCLRKRSQLIPEWMPSCRFNERAPEANDALF